MSSDDNLKAIDRDLSEVVDFCVSSGLGAEQIARSAKPLLSVSQSSSSRHLKSWMRRVVMVTVAVVVIAFLLQNTWTFRWICVAGKSLQVMILPYWDWTSLYQEECILPNPYIVIAKLTEEDCEMCEDYHQVDRVRDMSVEMVTDEYLFDNIPFIVTDASESWKAYAEFSGNFLKKLYTENEVLRSHDVCDYVNLNGQALAEILKNDKLSFHATWVNCKLPAIKAFRSYYQRPYFLPPMVELVLENFVAFSSGQMESSKEYGQFLEYYSNNDLTWFAQIRGSYVIQLRPKTPCDKICKTLEFVLHEGQTLVLTNEMWGLWITPSSKSTTIAIGSTGNWDS